MPLHGKSLCQNLVSKFEAAFEKLPSFVFNYDIMLEIETWILLSKQRIFSAIFSNKQFCNAIRLRQNLTIDIDFIAVTERYVLFVLAVTLRLQSN